MNEVTKLIYLAVFVCLITGIFYKKNEIFLALSKNVVKKEHVIMHRIRIDNEEIRIEERNGNFYLGEDIPISKEQFLLLEDVSKGESSSFDKKGITDLFFNEWPCS